MDGVLADLSSDQLSGWMAYYQLEPWGEYGAERRNAVLATLIANSHGSKAKPESFMPESWRERVHQTWAEMKRILLGHSGSR